MPADQVKAEEIVAVRSGSRVPLDGTVTSGNSAVNQAPITGESMPVEKKPGDQVFAGTINGEGSLEVRVTKVAGDTMLARIIQLVGQAQSEKAPAERFVAMTRRGVLIKGGAHLEAVGKLRALAVDKTRTITEGKPRVQRVVTFNGESEAEVTAIAAAIDTHSEHPLAKAVVAYAEEKGVTFARSADYQSRTGKGAEARLRILCRQSPLRARARRLHRGG